MKQNLNQIVISLLKNSKEKFLTAREIAEMIVEKEKNFCDAKIKRTTLKTKEEAIAQLRAEIGSCYAKTTLKQYVSRTADKPKKYYYDDKNSDISDTSVEKKAKNKQEEHKLYKKLAEYCKSRGIETLRINEKTSKKDGGENHNIWLHADVVGFKDLLATKNSATRECLICYPHEKSYLYSFEVKYEMKTTSNIRKFFFQTVSNSSWANFSYLVATRIEEKALEELQLLCTSFKIGFIQLNTNEPLESDIIIQAPKTELDWNMIDRIATENPDFRKYLKNIELSYKKHSNKDIQTPEWDIC